jgi:DNA-binding NarL/FixJ family response regulator
MDQTTVLIVDDHQILRQGLRTLLEAESDLDVVGEAGDGRAAMRMAKELRPDVVVMDISMPELNGIDATRRILEDRPATRVIALTAHADHRTAGEILRAGASGLVAKDGAFDELARAIRIVAAGKTYLDAGTAGGVVEHFVRAPTNGDGGPRAFATLSPREREVLQLVAEGKATKEVAAILSVSVKTIETHRRALMEKLHVESVAELTKYAIREGLTAL